MQTLHIENSEIPDAERMVITTCNTLHSGYGFSELWRSELCPFDLFVAPQHSSFVLNMSRYSERWGGHHLSVRCSGWSLCPLPPTYTPSCVCFYCESSWRRSSEGRVTNKLFFWLLDKGLFKLLAWDLCVFVWCEEEEILLSQLFLSSECQAVWRRSRPWERESDVCTQRVINDNRVRAGTRNVWLCSNYPPCGPVRAISRSLKMLRINFYWHTTAKCLVSLWQQRCADFLHLSHCENGITGSWVIVVSRHVAWHLVWGHVFCWCGSDGTLSRTRKMSIVQPFIGR